MMLMLPPDYAAIEVCHHRLEVRLAKNEAEIKAAKRLRYQVFVEEMGAKVEPQMVGESGIDQDEFDDYCDHLVAIDPLGPWVVGTYRILNTHQAQKMGRWYSEQEFDLSPFQSIHHSMVEVGRSCVHSHYRQGLTIAKLWAGLVDYMFRGNYTHLLGCASIALSLGDWQVQQILAILQDHLAPPEFQVQPLHPWQSTEYPAAHDDEQQAIAGVSIPPLIKGYLRAGAWICGNAAHDAAFNTADVLVLLPLDNVTERYRRHFMQREN